MTILYSLIIAPLPQLHFATTFSTLAVYLNGNFIAPKIQPPPPHTPEEGQFSLTSTVFIYPIFFNGIFFCSNRRV